MSDIWEARETTTHQDHVIAHVIGATVLAYFIFDEALYILLDIGFVWTILVDGEMGLLPHPVAVAELEMDDAIKQQVKADIDILLGNEASPQKLLRLTPSPFGCLIEAVDFFSAADRRRLIVTGEQASLIIETSVTDGEIQVMTLEGDKNDESAKLEDIAESEHQYLHQRLREELGREPTEEELDAWLRQHTEGY